MGNEVIALCSAPAIDESGARRWSVRAVKLCEEMCERVCMIVSFCGRR